MQGKIALEEHFAIADTLMISGGYFPDRVWEEVKSRIIDMHERRLALMDEYGIEMMLLSLNAPAVQAIPDPAHASEIARKANDYLAEQVRKRPDRFHGLGGACRCRSRSGGARTRTLRQGAWLSRRAGQRLFADQATPTPRSITTCRNIGRSGRRWRGSMCRSICTRAIRCRATPKFMTAIPG